MDSKEYREEIDLHEYWLVLKRRWLVGLATLATSAGLFGLIQLKQEPTYQATGRLLFQSNRTGAITGYGEKIGELESLKREASPLDTQAVVLQSLPVVQETINTLDLKGKDGLSLEPEAFAKKLVVEPLVGTDVLEISYESTKPDVAAEVVNQLMNSYIAGNIKTNLAEATTAGRFIKEQQPRIQAELSRASEELRNFKAQNRVINLDEEAKALVASISNLDEQISGATSQLADLTAQSAELSRQIGISSKSALDAASVSQAKGVQDVLAELQKVQTQLATEQARYTGDHPSIVSLKRQAATLQNLLQTRMAQVLKAQPTVSQLNLQMGEIRQAQFAELVKSEALRLGLERRLASLSKLREDYRKRADVLPALEKQQRDLEGNLSAAQKAYENLINRLDEIRVAENQNIGNARVIQSAVAPKRPEGLSPKILVLFGFGSILLSVAAVFFTDLIDRSVKTLDEVKEAFGYTLLGIIPKFEKNGNAKLSDRAEDKISSRIIMMNSPDSPIHEAYQMLQANLKFISSDKKIGVIAITSSIPQEGKSEVSANLAAVISQAGRRVILVDADMRNPSQHSLWNLKNTVGLSNVLAGQNELSQAVQEIDSNLAIFTSGIIPPNPLNLIDSERMTSIVETLSDCYEYVIFDTPPASRIADAAVLGKMTDGVLLVARPGLVDIDSAVAAQSILSRSGTHVLGIIANGVTESKKLYSYCYGKASTKPGLRQKQLQSSGSI